MMIGFDSFYDHLKNFVMGSDPNVVNPTST